MMKRNAALLFILGLSIFFSACGEKKQAAGAAALPQMSKDEGEVIKQREISVWEFSKTKQLDKLREILADDYIGYYATGNMFPSQVIDMMRNTTVRDYNLSNIVVKPITESSAVVYYDVSQDIVGADGSAWIPRVKASSVYVKRNGIWYSVFYQEMPRG